MSIESGLRMAPCKISISLSEDELEDITDILLSTGAKRGRMQRIQALGIKFCRYLEQVRQGDLFVKKG